MRSPYNSKQEPSIIYDEQVKLIEKNSGEPLKNVPYKLTRKSNNDLLAHGHTDEGGLTERVFCKNPDDIKILIG